MSGYIKKTWFKSGDWNATCDVCGFRFKASQLRKRWDGLMVCKDDWEPRHPQELIRPIKENISVPWTRPELPVIEIGVCSVTGINGVAGVGEAGCAVAGNDNGYRDQTFPSTFNGNTL